MKYSEIPTKIKEIISYLSNSFSGSSYEFDREELSQILWVVYFELLKKDKRAKHATPGFFYMKFRWHLINLYNREKLRKRKLRLQRVQERKKIDLSGYKCNKEHSVDES